MDAPIEVSPTPVDDDDEYYLGEEFLLKYISKPTGYWIKNSMEKNARIPHRTGLKDWYDYERTHIANPLDYVGTKPDRSV